MKYGYHCTTDKLYNRYKSSNRIILPVRFWPNKYLAERWCKRTGRNIIVKFPITRTNKDYPLPDHKPARWYESDVLFNDLEIVT